MCHTPVQMTGHYSRWFSIKRVHNICMNNIIKPYIDTIGKGLALDEHVIQCMLKAKNTMHGL